MKRRRPSSRKSWAPRHGGYRVLVVQLLLSVSTAWTTTPIQIPPSRSRIRLPHRFFLAPQQLGSFQELSDAPHLPPSVEQHRVVALYDWSTADPIAFQEAWDWQKDILDSHLDRLTNLADTTSFWTSSNHSHAGVDTVILLQHKPVYTLGTASDPSYVRSNTQQQIPTVRMDRGGEVTYHGPGQLVVYPILDLRSYRQDIHWYIRSLEEVALRALDKAGLAQAERQDNVTGVWVENRKVAAIGIKAKRWITMHGLAINVDHRSMSSFEGIVPCGLEGRQVGCVNQFLDKPVSMEKFAGYVKEAMEDVFRVQLDRIE